MDEVVIGSIQGAIMSKAVVRIVGSRRAEGWVIIYTRTKDMVKMQQSTACKPSCVMKPLASHQGPLSRSRPWAHIIIPLTEFFASNSNSGQVNIRPVKYSLSDIPAMIRLQITFCRIWPGFNGIKLNVKKTKASVINDRRCPTNGRIMAPKSLVAIIKFKGMQHLTISPKRGSHAA